jgi:protein-disulfide isomerase
MRYWRTAFAAIVVLALTLTGCARQIAGVAQPDSSKSGVAITDDDFGIVVGFPDAPAQIELYTEPQCDHCAHLQQEFGDEIKSHIESGQLAITYRPLTFLDDSFGNDYSAVASNALFLAADPSTTAEVFQTFVEDLWANQDLSYDNYSDGDFADIATESGLSAAVVENIGAGKSVVDTDSMSVFNGQQLLLVASGEIRTPVVYDVNAKSEVDVNDPKWLDKLVKSS